MIRTRSLRWLFAGLVVCFVIGAVVLLPGASTAAAQTSDNTPVLNETGDPESIQIGQSEQNISNIEILVPNQTTIDNEIWLSINITSLEGKGVNTSAASLSVEDIQHGSVRNTTQWRSDGRVILRATIRPDRSADSVQIDSARISGIDTKDAHKSRELLYNIGVSNTDTNPTEYIDKTTNKFKVIDGTIEVQDQATASPQLHRSGRTTAGITINNISGNVNSTLFVARGNNNEIIGIRSLRKSTLRTKQAVSVDTSYPGGDVKGFLVANSTIGATDYEIRDTLPPNVTRSALSTDEGRIVNADVDLANLSYESPQTDKVIIPSAKVTDTIEDETSFFVSLHPVNSTGYILQNTTVANSRVLTGWNENIALYFNTTDSMSGIFRSNRYAVAIQLSRGHNAGDRVSPKNFDLLQNSDLNNQFVSDGVADDGIISIEGSVHANLSQSGTGIRIRHNQSLNKPVYSGQTVYTNSSLNERKIELHKRIEDSEARVVSVGTRLNNSSYVGYNTSMLSSGTYYIHSKRKSSGMFEIIGNSNKKIELNYTQNRSSHGNHIRTSVFHSVPYLDLSLTNTANHTTTTIELNTSETGPTPITLNTYASPDSASFVTTGTGVGVESVSGTTDPLSPGTYNLTLRSEHGAEVANDTATITVDPRSTNDLLAYTTREVSPGGFENATAIREAIADGTLTPEPNATANDTVVYAVNATGLTGLPATANASLDRGADLERLDGLSFGVAPTETDAGNDSTGGTLGPTPNESAVHLDREGLYLVADGERAFGTETAPDPGETFEAAFHVDDDRLRQTAADGRHRVTTELTYAAADPVDGDTEGETADGSLETPTADGDSADAGESAESGTADPSGTSVGSADPPGPAGGGTAPGAGGPSPTGGPPGSDANRSGPPLGMGISIAPGTSEIPPSAGPPELFDTGRSERGSASPAVQGSRSVDGASDGGAGGGNTGATSAGAADSASTSGPTDPAASSERPTEGPDASDLDYDDAPIRSTAYDLPGFGAVASLVAVVCASLLARGRGPGS